MPTMDDMILINKYKDTMFQAVNLMYPMVNRDELEDVLNYSINKRYKNTEAQLVNTYTNKTANISLMDIVQYIESRHPIMTGGGVIFQNHEIVPNPLAVVVQRFLDNRSTYKKMMFKFPKGSSDYERYNLFQQGEKINVNAIYGVLGLCTSLIYNINVATTVTTQGRSLVSTMSLFFEQFLANNVKYGSVDEVIESIINIKNERYQRKFDDFSILDNPYVSVEDCFAKVVMSCGYRWIPTNDELEVIWQAVQNLDPTDRTRVYYKNNLYEFMNNRLPIYIVQQIMATLDEPFLNPNKPPQCIKEPLDYLADLMYEYVYYRYINIDRIDRCDNMIKSVIMISDTDSTIISLDAWYRYCLEFVKDMKDIPIRKVKINPLYFPEYDEFGDMKEKDRKKYMCPIEEYEQDYDYDFFNEELILMKHVTDPIIEYPQDNVRHSILNIMGYILDRLVNDYMEKYCENAGSFTKGGKIQCKILAKNEFTFKRLLMTPVKKSYASLQEVQEGNMVPEDKQLDIKGIASMAKSSMADSTRDALKKILLEDILRADHIDQLKIIKKIAILSKKITDSLYSGSKEFYKPVTVKATSSYKNPMSIQGIKASIVWNTIKDDSLPAINLEERNAVDIAKVKIDKKYIETIKDKYPEVYERCLSLLVDPNFKAGADSIAIPLEVEVPDWLLELVDYDTIVNDNVGGFVYDSIGIKRFGKSRINYTNILQL